MNLNPEQKLAVEHFTGPCVVTAVPGSGKTMTLTSRVVSLVRNHHINPKSILCLTFTNKAADEMRERVSAAIGQDASAIWISTFHSLCLAILRKYGSEVGLTKGFSIYSEKDQKELISKIARMQEVELNPRQISELAKAVNDFREDIEDFEKHTASFPPARRDVMREYLSTLDEFNAVDFSGILYKTWRLFAEKPKSAANLANLFRFVMIDEMQDTNTIQYEIVRAIADPNKSRQGNLFCVGDFNQSIFSWRGARPENIQRVLQDFDNVKEIVLPRNYRSTTQILTAAQHLIRHNRNASDVELLSTRGSGVDVVAKGYTYPEEEADRVVREIQRLRSASNYKYKDFAILYRTNELSKVPEMFLRRYGMPYRIIGGFSFYDRTEIKIALAYLSFLVNPHDTISFAKIIKSPRRGVGETLVGRLERFCHEQKISMLDACRRLDEIGASTIAKSSIKKLISDIEKWQEQDQSGASLAIIASGLLTDTGFLRFIEHDMSKDVNEAANRMANLEQLFVGIADFEKQKPQSRLMDFLHSVQLITSLDESDNDDDCVSLLTMHSAKGLEFPVVFVIGCEDGLVPHQLALAERGIDEERRLMYVAVTRAKDRLYLHHCVYRKRFSAKNQQHYITNVGPSPFLAELM